MSNYLDGENITVSEWIDILNQHHRNWDRAGNRDGAPPEYALDSILDLLQDNWYSYIVGPTSSGDHITHLMMFTIDQMLKDSNKRTRINSDEMYTLFEIGLNQPILQRLWTYGSWPRYGDICIHTDIPVAAFWIDLDECQVNYNVRTIEGIRKYLTGLLSFYKAQLRLYLTVYPSINQHPTLKTLFTTREGLDAWLSEEVR